MQTRKNNLNTIKRFWNKVNIKDKNECWEWIPPAGNNGYGKFSYVSMGKKKTISAHRYSLEVKYTFIPKGLCVLHKCDNKKCVNPNHLFLGTQKDNIADMFRKKRNPKLTGIKRNNKGIIRNSKLNPEQIKEIRAHPKNKGYQKYLAKKFNVSQCTISNVITNKQWAHIS